MVIVLIILLLVCIVFGGVYLYTNRETPVPVSELEPAPAPAPVSELEPVDCKYEWSDWLGCSTECGPGTISRTLKIIEKPQNGGKRCPPLTETSPCPNSKPCVPIDCKGEWDKANGGFVYAVNYDWDDSDHKHCVYGKRYFHKQKAKHGGKECTFPDGYTIIPFPGGRFSAATGWMMRGSRVKRNDECPLTAAWDPTIDTMHGGDKLIM